MRPPAQYQGPTSTTHHRLIIRVITVKLASLLFASSTCSPPPYPLRPTKMHSKTLKQTDGRSTVWDRTASIVIPRTVPVFLPAGTLPDIFPFSGSLWVSYFLVHRSSS